MLEIGLGVWNDKLAELWTLITQSPENFKGSDVWNVIVNINSAVQGFGYGLLVLFFAMGVFQSAAGFRELQRPEFALRHFIRFALAKVAVGYGMEIMTAIFKICNGIVQSTMSGIGGMASMTATLPTDIVTAVDDVGFLDSIPLWLVSLLGSLLIWVMSMILILTIYGRFFKLYLYTALAPLSLSSFAGEGTSSIGKSFLKSYSGVCLEGRDRGRILCNLFGVSVQQQSCCGYFAVCRDDGMAVHRTTGVQHDYSDRIGQGFQSVGARNVWHIKQVATRYSRRH